MKDSVLHLREQTSSMLLEVKILREQDEKLNESLALQIQQISAQESEIKSRREKLSVLEEDIEKMKQTILDKHQRIQHYKAGMSVVTPYSIIAKIIT